MVPEYGKAPPPKFGSGARGVDKLDQPCGAGLQISIRPRAAYSISETSEELVGQDAVQRTTGVVQLGDGLGALLIGCCEAELVHDSHELGD